MSAKLLHKTAPSTPRRAQNSVLPSMAKIVVPKKTIKCALNSIYIHKEYTIARNAYHKAIASAEFCYKREEVEEFVQEVAHGDFSALFKKARQSKSCMVKLEIFESHCKHLYNCHPDPILPILPPNIDSSHPIMAEIQTGEILQAINRQKSKACSYIGISPLEIIKLQNELTPILMVIFNRCLQTCSFPHLWLELVMFFIHKKGSREEPNNYRSIAIENPIYKVFSAILNNRLVKYAESHELLPKFQFGFVRGRNTLGAVALLKEIIDRRLQNKQRTYVAFIDFKKAFDSVDRSKLM